MSRIRTATRLAARRPDASRPAPPRAGAFGGRTVASLGLLLALGLAGCSSGGSTGAVASLGGASSSAAPSAAAGQRTDAAEQDARLKYAQCMRQHGVNMSDPNPGQAQQTLPVPDAATKQKIQTANTACASLLPNGGQTTAAQTEQALKFAQCMRQHGVNMPDPKVTSGGMSPSIDLSDPKAKAALSTCEQASSGGASSGG